MFIGPVFVKLDSGLNYTTGTMLILIITQPLIVSDTTRYLEGSRRTSDSHHLGNNVPYDGPYSLY